MRSLVLVQTPRLSLRSLLALVLVIGGGLGVEGFDRAELTLRRRWRADRTSRRQGLVRLGVEERQPRSERQAQVAEMAWWIASE